MENKKGLIFKPDYFKFLKEIREKIISTRVIAYQRINRELIKLYWEIGKIIVERQERFGWGEGIVEKLSRDLIAEFKGQEGFSASNLWRIRNFYLTYRDNLKLARLVQEIPWGQNIVIMQRIKTQEIREYYIKAAIQFGWSRGTLIHQVEAEVHKRARIKKMHNFPKALPAHLAEQMPRYEYRESQVQMAGAVEEVATEHLGIEVSNLGVRYLLNKLYNPKAAKGVFIYRERGRMI